VRRGIVSAAATLARSQEEPETFRNAHCSAEEYDDFLQSCSVAPHFIMQRRSYRRIFVREWPDLEGWSQAPLSDRLGRTSGQTRATLQNPPSYRARSYLYYLALTGRLRLGYDWLLALGDLCVHEVARPLGIDLGIVTLAREAEQLGLQYNNADRAMRWTLSRIHLHSNPRPIADLGEVDIDRLLVAIRGFAERPDLNAFWISAERYRRVAKGWITMVGQLRLVLYHRGQISVAPRKIMPAYAVRSKQPEMAALVERWLERRAPALRPATIYHLALTARAFLQHLEVIAPDVQVFSGVTRNHVLSWMEAMSRDISPKTGRRLAPHTQRGRVIRLAQFFHDAQAWGWEGVPRWPLVAVRDLPRRPDRIPRYIPAPELARVMVAIRALDCPYQRASLLLARWSGARRSEIRRLTMDCLDRYANGTARLRIPVGKTGRERLIPLHDEAAEALQAVLTLRMTATERPLPDERTGDLVRFVFVRYGKLMAYRYLFGTPLQKVCEAAGLVDVVGKAKVTPHRFRHTLGTELAERGAKLHTIMSVLGHESPQMSMVYARISDAEVLRDYRSVLEPGAIIAGAGAEAIRAGTLDTTAVDWLRSNFLKTELELGHCLRLPGEGPCECDLYLSCSRFVTTPAYAPRLRERHTLEVTLAADASERAWPREVERHCAIARRIETLLSELGEPLKR
jgi:integrase